MIIRYRDGNNIEAVLLSQDDRTLRVAIAGSDDVLELKNLNGTWVTDECEPVQVTFAWQQSGPAVVSEEECICSPDLAAKLIQMLMEPEPDAKGQPQSVSVTKAERAAAHAHVV